MELFDQLAAVYCEQVDKETRKISEISYRKVQEKLRQRQHNLFYPFRVHLQSQIEPVQSKTEFSSTVCCTEGHS